VFGKIETLKEITFPFQKLTSCSNIYNLNAMLSVGFQRKRPLEGLSRRWENTIKPNIKPIM
jgi:hypothetical protein